MDSEEDYMSGMSTDAEMMQEYSGDEMSAGEGTFSWNSYCFNNQSHFPELASGGEESLKAYKPYSARFRG